jgi:hypothetical protein
MSRCLASFIEAKPRFEMLLLSGTLPSLVSIKVGLMWLTLAIQPHGAKGVPMILSSTNIPS